MTKQHHFLLSIVGPFLLIACGSSTDQAPPSETSISARTATSKSPLERPAASQQAAELDIEALFALLPDGLKVTYGDVGFDKKIGATSVSNLKITAQGEIGSVAIDPNYFDGLTIGRAEFYGVDMDVFEKLSAYDGTLDAALEVAFEKVRLFDIVRGGSEGSGASGLKIGALEFDQLAIRDGGLPVDSAATPLAGLFNSFSLAGLYLQDVLARTDAEQANLSFSAQDLRFVEVAGGKVGAVIANNLEYEVNQSLASLEGEIAQAAGPAGQLFLNGPLRNFIAPENQRTTVGSIEWKNIDFSGLMVYGLKGQRPPLSATNLINLGSMSVLDTKTFIGEKMFSFFPEMVASVLEFTWLVPSRIRAEARRGVYDFTAYVSPDFEEFMDIFKRYGLDEVKADSVIRYDWDAKKGGADLVVSYETDGLADYNMNIALEGLNLKEIEAAVEAGTDNPAVDLAALEGLSIAVADEKLLDLFFELAGIQSGMSAKNARQVALGGLQLSRLRAMQYGGRFNDYIDAVVGFVEDGGTLTIDISPEQAVPFADISAASAQDPQALPDILNITITHDE